MSGIYDPDKMSSREMVAQFVLECRGTGHCLPYGDYEIIEQWLQKCPNVDRLLLILNDHLPEYYSKSSNRPVAPRLTGIRKKVLASLDAKPPEDARE